MKTYAEIAAHVGASERLVREIAGHLGHDGAALGVVQGFPKGEAHWNAKLTAAQVREIRRLVAEHWVLKDIADRFGIGRKQVAAIRGRRSWRHVE